MKKRIRTAAVMLLAGFLALCPAVKPQAANEYSLSDGEIDGKVIFPGDSLQDVIALTIGADRVPAELSEGFWTNSTGRAYRIRLEEDEAWLEPAGCMLTVRGGTSSSDSGESERTTDWGENGIVEMAVYSAGSQITVRAETPDGKIFDHWDVSGDIHVEDTHASEIHFTMPEGDATLTAVFKDAGEAGQENGNPPPSDQPGEEQHAESPQDEGQNAENPQDEGQNEQDQQGEGQNGEDQWSEGGNAEDPWSESGNAENPQGEGQNGEDQWSEGGNGEDSWIEGGNAENPQGEGQNGEDQWIEGGNGEDQDIVTVNPSEEPEGGWDPFNGGTGTVLPGDQPSENGGNSQPEQSPGDTPSEQPSDDVVNGGEYGALPGDGQLPENGENEGSVSNGGEPADEEEPSGPSDEAGPSDDGFDSESHRHHVTVIGGEGTGDYQFGDSVEITAYDGGWDEFPGWTTQNDTVWFANSHEMITSFSMPDEDVTVSVTGAEEGEQGEDPGTSEGPGENEDSGNNGAPGGTDGAEEGEGPDGSDGAEEGEGPDGSDGAEEGEGPGGSDGAEEGKDPDGSGEAGEGDDSGSQEAEGRYTVTVYGNSEEAAEEGEYAPGEEVEITAPEPDENEIFDSWDAIGITLEDPFAETIVFTMPENNVVLTASYVDDEEGPPETDSTEETQAYTVILQNRNGEIVETSEYEPGEFVEIDAPDEGEEYEFSEWITQGIMLEDPTDPTASFDMPENDVILTPDYTEVSVDDNTYLLVVENGEGSGFYEEGETVYINGDSENGEFAGWDTDSEAVEFEDDTAESTSIVMPSEDVIVTANYDENETEVYLVLLRDINGDVLETIEYVTGDHVEIDAPDAGEEYEFTRWTADGAILDDPEQTTASFDMPANDVILTPNYKEVEQPEDHTAYLITLGPEVSYISGAGYDSNGRLTAEKGDMITVSAPVVNGDRVLDHWSVTRTSSGSSVRYYTSSSGTISFAMPAADVSVSAMYRTIPANNVNVVNGTGGGTYNPGTGVVIRAYSAPAGMRFSRWVVDYGDIVLSDRYAPTTGFTMGNSPVQVRAEYVRNGYALDVQNGSGDGTYAAGTGVTIRADWPASGKEFNSWVVQSGSPSIYDVSRLSTTLTMPSSNVVVTATYRNGPDPAYNTIEGIAEGGRYAKGETLTFTAVGNGMSNTYPNPGDYRYRPSGYKIGSVTGSWTNDTYTTSMAINAVGDYTLTVTFSKEVYDGSRWNPDGTYDTKSVHFQVVSMTSVETGDTTPLIPLIAIAAAALAVIVAAVVLLTGRRK